ncbi:MAG TPA: hypothetical protein VM266_16215 [Solirubrobacteraceae bacterium]|nr:hypothetical protein [Solirubrobacteraceae bacterium]
MTSDDYTAARYDEMPSKWDGFVNLVRPGLGIGAFGVNVMNLPPDYATREHDETESGQEELYVALAGSGAVVVGETRLELDPERAVRVGPSVRRALASGADGQRVMIVGGVPGQAYEPSPWSSEGD